MWFLDHLPELELQNEASPLDTVLKACEARRRVFFESSRFSGSLSQVTGLVQGQWQQANHPKMLCVQHTHWDLLCFDSLVLVELALGVKGRAAFRLV